MSILDELRESLRRRTLPMNSKRLQREIADAIDAFEAAHPGLVDAGSGPCACPCGAIYWRSDVLRVCPACAREATP